MNGPQRTFDPGRFEGILSAKLSSYVSAAVLALLVGWIVSSGSITFKAVTQETPEIQRILAPPVSRATPRLDFQRTLTLQEIESLDFDAFRDERSERRAEIPTVVETPTVPDEREAAAASPALQPELMVEDAAGPEAVDAPGDAPAPPPGAGLMDRDASSEPAGTAGSAAGTGPALRRGAALSEGSGRGDRRSGSGESGAGVGVQGSGRDVAAGTGDAGAILATPVVSHVPDTPVRGASAGSEKQALIDWVRDHPFALSAAVAAALEVDALKDDGTAHIVFADTAGRQYEVFLLHRSERDLLRLLVVQDDRAWRLDLPERDLVVAHVQAGRVQRADFGAPGQTGADAPIIEVSLAAVGAIPSEAETAFGLVRGWLAGERDAPDREGAVTMRRGVALYCVALLLLAAIGCGGGTKTAPATDTAAPGADATVATGVSTSAPPPLVPVGLDTSFVVQADSLYGVVLDADALAGFAAEDAELRRSQQAVDTLAALSRFVRESTGAARPAVMTAADTAMVAGLLLRADAEAMPTAAAALAVQTSLDRLDDQARRADSLGVAMARAGEDPVRAAVAAETADALDDLDTASRSLRGRLQALLAELEVGALAADSARVQQEVSALVRDYGGELDASINVLGRAAQDIGPATLSSDALHELAATLEAQRDAVGSFDMRWEQFRDTGSLELGDPRRPYDPKPMASLLARLDGELDALATAARTRAVAIDSAGNIRDELAARREAENFLLETQRGLAAIKGRTAELMTAYRDATSGYWQRRLEQAARAEADREVLYKQLDDLVSREGVARIRQDTELLATYRRLSDRLLERHRQRLRAVESHDALREAAREDLARATAERARVLGERSDYLVASTLWRSLAVDRPGEPTPRYRLATLAYQQAAEPWAAAQLDSLHAETLEEADRCEAVVLERHAFRQDMDAARDDVVAAAGGTRTADVDSLAAATAARGSTDASAEPRFTLTRLAVADSNWYYARLAYRARADLAALDAALDDAAVRGWLLSLDDLRRRVAFDVAAGDDFLYRYARQAYLDTLIAPEEARRVLRYWSWDDGHLTLRRTWTRQAQLPDSTAALGAMKRDSVATVLATARTAGVRRALGWRLAALDFDQTAARDAGLERMHRLLQDASVRPNPDPEAGAIDSTIAAGYPVYLFNRGTYYQQDGRRREAFYCYLGVAEKYGQDAPTRAVARYSAAALLADGDKRGALRLVRQSIGEALQVVEQDPTAFDPALLARMYELRRQLAGDLALYDEAVAAREEAQRLRTILEAAQGEATGGAP